MGKLAGKLTETLKKYLWLSLNNHASWLNYTCRFLTMIKMGQTNENLARKRKAKMIAMPMMMFGTTWESSKMML